MEFFEDGRLELYNLREDIGETKNLASAMPDKARELLDRMQAWRGEIGAPMPKKNEARADPAQPRKKKGKNNPKEATS